MPLVQGSSAMEGSEQPAKHSLPPTGRRWMAHPATGAFFPEPSGEVVSSGRIDSAHYEYAQMHNFPVPNRRLRIFPLSQISVFCMTKSLRKPLTYRRRISPQSRYSIYEYASLTAETIWAWNRLHSTLLDLFSSLLEKGGTKRKEAYAIWHTIQSDSVQRTLLENVAEAALSEKSHKLKQIIWLLKSIGRIAAYRNATVHTPIVFQIIDIDLPAAIYLDYEGARKNWLTGSRRLG